MSRRLMIKICGIAAQKDLVFCQDRDIDLTGFIFHPSSPRFVKPEMVGSWKKKNELRVGVFVDQKPLEILEIIDQAGLDLAQLHGGQSPDDCLAVGADRVIRAFWPERFVRPADFQLEIERFKDVSSFFLFDAGKKSGGHGKSISSPWLSEIVSPKPYFLAGGLGPDNVEDMLGLGMAGLDLNSGVEKNPGRKDQELIQQVLKIVRR